MKNITRTRLWGTFNDAHKHLTPTIINAPQALRVSCGYDHMGYINNENNLFLFGRNHKGQCAEPKENDTLDVPSQPSFSRYANFDDYDAIDHDYQSAYVKPGLQFSNLYCQKLFTLALTLDKKSLFACGVNDSGQL